MPDKKKGDHHRMMMREFRKRFFVSMILTIPVLILSPTIQDWFGFSVAFSGRGYVLLGIAVILFVYGGYPFLKGLFNELKDGSPGMMTLIALAISVAFIYSGAVTLGLRGKVFYWELATLIDVMLLGHWIEMRSVMGASRALDKLAEMMPDVAHLRKQDGSVEDVKVDEISKGDRVLVKPGEKIPLDGVIVRGEGYIDESMMTGESKPVKKGEEEEVMGGTVNGDSSLEVEVSRTGEDSYLSKVIKMVSEAQESQSKTQKLADTAAMWLTIVAITAGIGTLVTWLILSPDASFAVERMATVMVITCPHALGLAIPLVVAVSTSFSAKNGLLIRNRTSFERSRKIKRVVFDKTGTLTEGKFGVNSLYPIEGGMTEEELLKIMASMESPSEHPIAKGILDEAEKRKIEPEEVDDFENIKGEGVRAFYQGREMVIGGRRYLEREGIEIPDVDLDDPVSTVIYLVESGEVLGVASISDRIRESSKRAVEELKEMGIESWMLTGDNERVASWVSEEIGLKGYHADILPHEKREKIEEMQESGDIVAMTGDGVNDAPALAQADVGIAIGSGTDIAAETADIVLVESDPLDVVKLIKFGKKTYDKMIQNLIWATGYNVIAIPLAAGVLYSFGIVISPAVGAALMSASTVIVAINAKLLSRGMGKATG